MPNHQQNQHNHQWGLFKLLHLPAVNKENHPLAANVESPKQDGKQWSEDSPPVRMNTQWVLPMDGSSSK